jgi:hypothetical protein
MSAPFELDYDKAPYWRWDHFGLAACQDGNYGNEPNWFYPFRGGLNGFHTRMEGAKYHYRMLHAWLPQRRLPTEFEYHLSTFFFNADSAVECLTFALNALGYAAFRGEFLSIADEKSLREITPQILLGNSSRSGRRSHTSPSGFSRIFQKTGALWRSRVSLLEQVFEQHDVSKHRHMIYVGGSGRTEDAPEGFWEELQVAEADRSRYYPMREIILGNDLKKPLEQRKSQHPEEFIYLEDIASDFFTLMSETGHTILEDSLTNIPLRVPLNDCSCFEPSNQRIS